MATSIRETIVSWLFSMASSASKKANLAKAAKLKIYDCRLSWTDPKVITSSGKPASVAIGTTVIADSEHRARQMSQERANKEDPVITSAF
jgi:exopolysaccharide biosynthesis protein